MRTRAARTAEPGLMRLAIDGVPVVYKAVPGPLRAALVFRVGVVDEALHERGLTHLVEHLALTHAPDQVHAFNGSTGSHFTQFVIAGDGEEVVDFFGLVCAGLSEPHFGRLDHERGVLKAEASTRSSFNGDDQLIWRFGPLGVAGTASYEWGAVVADDDAVDAWINEYFHSANCGLWLTGPPPKGLRLELPAGMTRASVPADLDRAVIPLPAVFGRGRPETTVSWVVPDKRGASTLGMVISDRMTTALRHEAGLAYGSRITVERAGVDSIWQMVAVDATIETAADVQLGIVKVLEGLRENPPTSAEIKKVRTQADLARQDGNSAVGHLDYWTRELLLGRVPNTTAKTENLWSTLQPEDVQALVPEVMGSLLIGAPYPDRVPSDLATRASDWSEKTFKGSMVLPVLDLSKQDTGILFLAKDGVSIVRDEGRVISIAIADCVAAFTYDDGSVRLFSREGYQLFLAIEDWIGQSEITRWIAALPPMLVHPIGTREQRVVAAAPRITGAGYAPKTSSPKRSGSRWARIAAPTLVAVLLASRAISAAVSPDSGDSGITVPPDTIDLSKRIGEPTHFGAGDCFTTAGTVVGCSQLHEHEVLPDSAGTTLSLTDALDQARCDEIWAVLGISHPDFRVTVRLQASNGLAEVLCVASRIDGRSSRGTVTVRS